MLLPNLWEIFKKQIELYILMDNSVARRESQEEPSKRKCISANNFYHLLVLTLVLKLQYITFTASLIAF